MDVLALSSRDLERDRDRECDRDRDLESCRLEELTVADFLFFPFSRLVGSDLLLCSHIAALSVRRDLLEGGSVMGSGGKEVRKGGYNCDMS